MMASLTDNRLTSDPATAHCRVYVGGLREEMTRSDLENYFESYGEVLGKTFVGEFPF